MERPLRTLGEIGLVKGRDTAFIALCYDVELLYQTASSKVISESCTGG